MANTFSKLELASAISDKQEISQASANELVQAVLGTIMEEVKNGKEVRLMGFGTFSKAHRKATTGRNPSTGESIKISASNRPKFKAGKGFKDLLN
ncbi:MAG: HU family DNA-binding protein [Alphaproteobacteria bacterium]|nr:HU family DNA-binding protein [Alphaproteobacteria bacterium]MBL0717868.1 HU family DNA-binding protein [Alphaproteobacteria bacterium]